jgi:hypothetical protein
MNDDKREGVSLFCLKVSTAHELFTQFLAPLLISIHPRRLNYYRPLTPHLDLQQQTVGCAEGFTKKEAL